MSILVNKAEDFLDLEHRLSKNKWTSSDESVWAAFDLFQFVDWLEYRKLSVPSENKNELICLYIEELAKARRKKIMKMAREKAKAEKKSTSD